MPSNESPIDLSSGFPAPSLNPIQQLNDATNTVFSNPDIWHDGMIYGADAGYEPFRQNVARWLSDFYYSDASSNDTIDADRICITGGASQNLACLLQVFTDPIVTRNIFVVEPGYFLAFRIFEDAGFAGRLRGVPEDEKGIDLGFLEEVLKQEEKTRLSDETPFKPYRSYRKLYRHVIYCVPTFSNPSGRIMSLSRRQGLIRLARQYDALIIADDVYDFVHWPTAPSLDLTTSTNTFKSIIPRLIDIDRTLDGGPIDTFGNCVSNGSFSKLVGPGCRVGWAEGTPAFAYGLSQAGSSRSGGAPSHLMSTFINEMVRAATENDGSPTAMTTHILHTLIPAYSRRYNALMSAIIQYLCPLGVVLPPTNEFNQGGGFFIWLELPAPLKSHEVAAAAREGGVVIGNGAVSALPEGNDGLASYDNFIRLCFAWADEDRLVDGIRGLGKTLRRLIREQPTS
ncbi:pyridoxal phosphate-dependent transferase, partial [Aspergillus karnatakaensis]|uniref:aminotransferase-like domain-containing protein n=1 Tax=Aspergillus karnatakaensis TaxID=1810916 RepID=UPI003CCE1614